jgi:hypothetical protein
MKMKHHQSSRKKGSIICSHKEKEASVYIESCVISGVNIGSIYGSNVITGRLCGNHRSSGAFDYVEIIILIWIIVVV